MSTSTTNILAIPVVDATIQTGNNEDWIDSFMYYLDDGADPPNQLDLRGIKFAMEIRRSPPESEVVLEATTDNGSLAFGIAPDFGYLVIYISKESMKIRDPGEYVGEMVATDGVYTRVTMHINLTIIEGVAR